MLIAYMASALNDHLRSVCLNYSMSIHTDVHKFQSYFTNANRWSYQICRDFYSLKHIRPIVRGKPRGPCVNHKRAAYRLNKRCLISYKLENWYSVFSGIEQMLHPKIYRHNTTCTAWKSATAYCIPSFLISLKPGESLFTIVLNAKSFWHIWEEYGRVAVADFVVRSWSYRRSKSLRGHTIPAWQR